MSLVVVDACGANISSVLSALSRAGCAPVVSDDANVIKAADRVILPGVGAAGNAMARLRSCGLEGVIPTLTQPVLGICVGMQVLFESSEEDDVDCLGVFDARLGKFHVDTDCPVPHMGWNKIEPIVDHPLFADLPESAYCYFVHSYRAPCFDHTVASTTYGSAFTAAVARDNFAGVQFHPERSAAIGAQVLENFLQWRV